MVEIGLSNEQPQAWRAAWVLKNCMQKNDPRMLPFVPSILEGFLGKPEGHQRELIKILLLMDLSEEQEGQLFDICMIIWSEINNIPSLRHIAFISIAATVKKYAELKNELVLLTEDRYIDTLSPGIKRTINRLRLEILR